MKTIPFITLSISSILYSLFIWLSTSVGVTPTKQVPQSFKYKLSDNVPIIELPLTDDSVRNFTKNMAEFAYIDIALSVNYPFNTIGRWDTLPKGGRVWRVTLYKKGAPALGVFLNELKIPNDAYFFAYSKNKEFVVGPINKSNSKDDSQTILIRNIIGDEVTIEYFEPVAYYQNSNFTLNTVIHCIGDNPPSMTQKLKKKIASVQPIPKDTLSVWIKQHGEPEYGMGGIPGQNLKNSGKWENLKNGDRVWRLELDGRHLPRVANTSISFKENSFKIPKGAALYLYTPDKTDVCGPITAWDSYVKDLAGNTIILEYYEPKSVRGQGWFEVAYIDYQLKITAQKDIECNSCTNCTANVRCSDTHGDNANYVPPIPTNIQSQVDMVKNSVVKITCQYTATGFPQQPCTGTLMRNKTDPNSFYILTAGHCLFKDFWRASPTPPNNKVSNFKFRFNFERKKESGICVNSYELPPLETIGGTVVATSPQPSTTGNSDARSDFALALLHQWYQCGGYVVKIRDKITNFAFVNSSLRN
jgi:uncharacterized protein (DUF2249 family)